MASETGGAIEAGMAGGTCSGIAFKGALGRAYKGVKRNNMDKQYLMFCVIWNPNLNLMVKILSRFHNLTKLSLGRSVSRHPDFNGNFVKRNHGDPFYLSSLYPV